jgi:hypothetical protein
MPAGMQHTIISSIIFPVRFIFSSKADKAGLPDC